MVNAGKKRPKRAMIFLNTQELGLTKGPYIHRSDPIMLDLGDVVTENQEDTTRFSLYHTPRTIDYRRCERVMHISGLDTPYWKEDTRRAVAGGCDVIHIPKTERFEDVGTAEGRIGAAKKEPDIPGGRTLVMAAIESVRGAIKALDICEASERLLGITLLDGDYTEDPQTRIIRTGIEPMGAHQNTVIAARATGVQCFDTVYTNLGGMEGFRGDMETICLTGFDGRSIINPRQIIIAHEISAPTPEDIILAEKVVKEIDDKETRGIGALTVDSKMIDITFYNGARRVTTLVKASGVYKGDL